MQQNSHWAALRFLLLILAGSWVWSTGTTEGSQGTTVSPHSASALVTQVSTSLLLMWIGKDFTTSWGLLLLWQQGGCITHGSPSTVFHRKNTLYCMYYIRQCHQKHCTRWTMCNLTWIYYIENRIYDFRCTCFPSVQVWTFERNPE